MRDLYLIFGMAAVAVIIGVCLFLLAPSFRSDISTAIAPGTTSTSLVIPFTLLAQGPTAYSVSDRTNYRITNMADLRTLWPLIYGDIDVPRIPNVDFNKYEILGVFDGSHITNGYAIQVQSVQDQNSVRTIYIVHQIPDARCTLRRVQASPFEIIQVPKTTFSLAHQDEVSTTTCQ